MRQTSYIIICVAAVAVACGRSGGEAQDMSAADSCAARPDTLVPDTRSGHRNGATPLRAPAMAVPAPPPAESGAVVAPHVARPCVRDGMRVSDALRVPGAVQTVSAIMTGGKITGTVVVQWRGESWYTNVDFAEEGCYANGTRYTSPDEVQAFIELACSDQAVPSDFTDDAILTGRIR